MTHSGTLLTVPIMMSSNIYIQRFCQECGKEFTVRTTVTEFCSPYCAKNNYKKRKRQEQIEQSEIESHENKLKVIKTIQEKEFLTFKDTCLLLGISRTTLYRLRKKGLIKFTTIGNKKLVPRKSIDLLFSHQESEGEGIFLRNVIRD